MRQMTSIQLRLRRKNVSHMKPASVLDQSKVGVEPEISHAFQEVAYREAGRTVPSAAVPWRHMGVYLSARPMKLSCIKAQEYLQNARGFTRIRLPTATSAIVASELYAHVLVSDDRTPLPDFGQKASMFIARGCTSKKG
jgi:hypothetical protein